MPIAQQSKFACLKIYDDTSSSEDEGKRIMNIGQEKKGSQKSAGKKAAKKGENNGPLLVHVLPQKPKNRGKKHKKMPQVVDETGIVIQDPDLDPAEMKYREELRKALKESCETSSVKAQRSTETVTARPKVEKVEKVEEQQETKRSPAECAVMEIDKEAKKLLAGTSKNPESVVRLYRSKLLAVLEENSRLNEELSKAQANVMKYRSRYTKLCEILKDVEINEKAQLVAQLEKARQVETEMGNQIGTLRGELMQATSKNREFEAKIKELTKR
ncbi:unnamed protein product [Enterobius vermicularis]|uniref:Centromere protein U n=1 Tax=Enterobius vermicularis TaxID=51028 RepID=A0A0N4V7E5_ENTVE|nr:unnamed protein product [Enterobius vermicularis]